ncbi:TPA: hypothetical protein R0C45_003025 [Kluyvera ascorbata F0526]|nr:hypothetical protein [Kluyvera ascorbata F0526]
MISIKVLEKINPPLKWSPVIGEATNSFIDSKSNPISGPTIEELTHGENSLIQEAMRILGRCLPPSESVGSETGLVVGYVQSGKTMSFETVISLAKDNGYGLVIVFVGTKINLQQQSEERLIKDLEIGEEDYWSHFSTSQNIQSEHVIGKLNSWKINRTQKKSIIITVLKQAKHLQNLHTLLKKIPLKNVPVLIIDDESDQASLNTLASKIKTGKEVSSAKSTIYEWIFNVRKVIPHHSYLQYTATPQALLLMAQADLLNPSFAEIVTPGVAYTGGISFFKGSGELLEDIPSYEVPTKENEIKVIPKSLVKALKYFVLVCGQHAILKSQCTNKADRKKDRNRSMMVHPAMQTISHKQYKVWMDAALKALRRLISDNLKKNNLEIIESYFLNEYNALNKTSPKFSSLPDLIRSIYENVLNDLYCVEINGTPDAEKKVNWKSNPYWILVGGAKLDRGYTVEGLVTTYMPRPLGTSPSADTLQQRARFFGYKKAYLGQCRIFLQEDVKNAFIEYVEHEEYVRSILIKNRGEPLSQWRRDFILGEELKPTRSNVIGRAIQRIDISNWLVPKRLHKDKKAIKENQTLLTSVRKKWEKEHSPVVDAITMLQLSKVSHSNSELIMNIPLRAILDDFLLNIQVKDPQDAEAHSATLIALSSFLKEFPDLNVDVVFINKLQPQYRSRHGKTIDERRHENAPINQYFSNSANSVNDKSFTSENNITLQLRTFDLGFVVKDPSSADIKNVVWYAVHIPDGLAKNILVEGREEHE